MVCGGRLFHARAAATRNARSPRVDRRVDGGQSVDGDERRFRMSAAGFLLDTPVLCHAHNDTQEHTTGTGFVPVHVTSAAPGAVESCETEKSQHLFSSSHPGNKDTS